MDSVHKNTKQMQVLWEKKTCEQMIIDGMVKSGMKKDVNNTVSFTRGGLQRHLN
jgi:hypothetical protein